MDEKPKSIWKKSWQSRHWFRAWLILLAATFFIIVIIGGLAGNLRGWHDWQPALIFTVIVSLIIATVFVSLWIFIRWLFCWRNFKRFLFGLACFITLIALFYAEEDWRGKHDLEKFKREWAAKGEHFDFASVIPPPVPDNQNFALTPIVFTSYSSMLTRDGKAIPWKDRDTNFVDRLALNIWRNDNSENEPTNGFWAKGTIIDLKPWQAYYRAPVVTNRNLTITTNEFPIAPQPQTPAQDVLLALSKYDPAIEELRQASQLPYSRFPLEYDGMPAAILLPHLAALKRCSQVLQLRAIAELQNNENQKALDDVKLSLRLTDSIRTEPFLISHLVRIAILQIALQPVYEGLAEHKWSDTQLADLDSELATLDFLADYKFAMRGERALCIGDIEFFRHPHDQIQRPHLYFMAPLLYLIQEMSNEGEDSHMSFQMLALSFGPSGWIDQNELRIAQFDTKWYLPIVDQQAQIISPAKVRAAGNALNREIRHRTLENVLETLLMPSFGGAAEKFARAQSSTDLARVAVALERCQLAYGEYPKSLDALAPQFIAQIPHDVINGQPLRYRRTDDGQFVLYSVGWNETDDGGVVGLTKSGGVNNEKGDWVWRYPAK